jgi:hypothetical protein
MPRENLGMLNHEVSSVPRMQTRSQIRHFRAIRESAFYPLCATLLRKVAASESVGDGISYRKRARAHGRRATLAPGHRPFDRKIVKSKSNFVHKPILHRRPGATRPTWTIERSWTQDAMPLRVIPPRAVKTKTEAYAN